VPFYRVWGTGDKALTRQEPILICREGPFSFDLALIPKWNDRYSSVSPLLKEQRHYASHAVRRPV
jgi:hypothetical protein